MHNVLKINQKFLKKSLARHGGFVTLCPSKDCSGGNNSPSRHSVAAGCIFSGFSRESGARETLNKSARPCASDFHRLPASLVEAGSSEPASARDFAILQNWLAPVSRCFIQRFPRIDRNRRSRRFTQRSLIHGN
jgi:hypothetical protein